MGDQTRQSRLAHLRDADAQGRLSEQEREELAALVAERCQHEQVNIEEATRRTEADNARLEERLRLVQAQNRQLEALLQEQEAYLTDVEAIISQMETRRRDWRERYTRLTGRPPGEPIGAEPGR